MLQTPRRSPYRPFGKYQPIRQLAKGVVGVTYLAEDPNGETVVLKLLYSRIAAVRRRLMRFYQEAKLAMDIEHPNLVQTLEVGCQDGRHFLAMKRVPGISLRERVHQHGPLSEVEALRVLDQLAAAVEALHRRGVMHRDISPDNVLIDADDHVVLVDLGLAKEPAVQLDLTIDNGGLGDPQFIAPEQFRDAKHVSCAADIYGLGATLSFLLTGQLPFPGTTPSAVLVAKWSSPYRLADRFQTTLSPLTRSLVHEMMSRSPARRPASALQLRKRIAQCLRHGARAAFGDAPSPVASRHGLCTVLMRTRQGAPVRRELTEVQIIRLVETGELTGSDRVAFGADRRFLPLSETAQFAALFRRQPLRRRSWHKLSRLIGAVLRQLKRLGEVVWKWLRAEMSAEPENRCAFAGDKLSSSSCTSISRT